MFDSKESATNGEPSLYLIPFVGVSSIEPTRQGKDGIIVTLQNEKTHTFLSPDYQLLLENCLLLWNLPDHYVPEVPNYCLVSQEHIDRYKDPSKYDASK